MQQRDIYGSSKLICLEKVQNTSEAPIKIVLIVVQMLTKFSIVGAQNTHADNTLSNKCPQCNVFWSVPSHHSKSVSLFHALENETVKSVGHQWGKKLSHVLGLLKLSFFPSISNKNQALKQHEFFSLKNSVLHRTLDSEKHLGL